MVVAGGVVFGAPWWPYPYAYPYPYYPYVPPAYGGPAYNEEPGYVEQSEAYYYCPDYQDYYPNVPTCPSPWVEVAPTPSGYTN